MRQYSLSAGAEDDLRALYRYGVLTFGVAVADRYYDGLMQRFEEIAENPRLYQPVDAIRPGYRRSVFRGVCSWPNAPRSWCPGRDTSLPYFDEPLVRRALGWA
jgi:plasmid stabilization system protein ParE